LSGAAARAAGPGVRPAAALLAFAAVLAVPFSRVRATNFGGVDEWVFLHLNSHVILGFPHMNRPFNLAWAQPAAWLWPESFLGYHLVHAAYLVLGAWLAFLLVRALAPEEPRLAWLTGLFTAVWAPLDMGRLASVQGCLNSGPTVGCLTALVLFVRSWERGRPAWLALACLIALLTARTYEAVLGLLLGAPLLLPFVRREGGGGRTWAWIAAWEGTALLALALAALPLVTGDAAAAYQAQLAGADLHPLRYVGRLLRQYALHLAPLVPHEPRELLHPAAALAAALTVAGWWAFRPGSGSVSPASRPRLLAFAALGLVLAGLGYAVLVVSPIVRTATRTQYLSGPGIALFLAAAILLAAGVAPAKARPFVPVVAGAAVAAVGAGHIIGMQQVWDRTSAYPAQVESLRELTALAPDLRPNTLLLLIDEAGAWPASVAFRHAVSYLYRDRAVGHVIGADPVLYPLARTPEGFWSLPWPVIREAWRSPPSFHRYDEVVALRFSAARELRMLGEWDAARLPPLPPGALYAPEARIVRDGAPPPERRVLAEEARP